MSTIKFNNTDYPLRYVTMAGFDYKIATTALAQVLIRGEDGLPSSREAEVLENSIAYYCEPNEIDLPEMELQAILRPVLVE